MPVSVYDRFWLVASLAELGRFAEAALYEAEMLRLAEPTQHAFTVSAAHFAAGRLHLLKGDWAKARSLVEHGIAMLRTGNIVQDLPGAVASSAWVLAQVGEASEALTRLREGEQLLERAARGNVSCFRWGADYTRWVVPVCCSAGSTRRGAWATAPSNSLRLAPGSRPMRCTCSATSRPIPTGSMPSAARPHYRKALALAEPRGMRPLDRPLPPRPRDALPAHRQARAGPRARDHCHDHVPRDGHALLAREGRDGAESVRRVDYSPDGCG